jgi:hypothetical protein
MQGRQTASAGHPVGVSPVHWYWWLTGISILGSGDIAQFLASNRAMFTSAPGRAAGSVLGLLLWLLLTWLAGKAASGHRSAALDRGTVAVAGVVAVGSVGLAGIHAAVHVGGLRPALGGVLGVAAVGLAIAAARS